MSITFYPAAVDGAVTRPLLRCICDELEAAHAEGRDNGVRCVACIASLNMNTRNAADLLAYLGLEVSPRFDCGGHIDGPQLVALCERRLGMVYVEAALPTEQRGRLIECGRPAEYLLNRCRDLLLIAKMCGPGFRVAWS